MNCPLCSVVLADRGYYCQSCAAQVRCKACRELLEPGALACVECGTRIAQPVAEGSVAAGASVQHPLEAHRNTLSYQETKNDRSFTASLTDTAIQGLGEALGDFFVRRETTRAPIQHRRAPGGGLALPAPAITQNGDGGHHEVIHSASDAEVSGSDQSNVLKLFVKNGEALELKDNRLKAKSQSDFVRRLTCIFLYAHELHGRPSASYEELRTIHKVAKVWDANTRTWFGKRVGFTVDADKQYKLNAPGREDAIKTLNDALNPDVPDEWNPDKKITRKYTSRKKD
jgi:hypothetical protein